MNVLISLTMIILSKCIDVSNIPYIYTVDYTSVKLGRNEKVLKEKKSPLKIPYTTKCPSKRRKKLRHSQINKNQKSYHH